MFDRIGVELEGGFIRSRELKLAHDGSLFDLRGDVGEIRSEPVRWNNGNTFVPRALRMWKEEFPDYVNQSCGLHFHVSGSLNVLTTLMDVKCFHFMRLNLPDVIKAYGCSRTQRMFEDRCDPEHSYCRMEPQVVYIGEQWQIRNRYHWINGMAYLNHSTVEFRALPAMTDPNEAVRIIYHTALLLEQYCKSNLTPRVIERKV